MSNWTFERKHLIEIFSKNDESIDDFFNHRNNYIDLDYINENEEYRISEYFNKNHESYFFKLDDEIYYQNTFDLSHINLEALKHFDNLS